MSRHLSINVFSFAIAFLCSLKEHLNKQTKNISFNMYGFYLSVFICPSLYPMVWLLHLSLSWNNLQDFLMTSNLPSHYLFSILLHLWDICCYRHIIITMTISPSFGKLIIAFLLFYCLLASCVLCPAFTTGSQQTLPHSSLWSPLLSVQL